jgi:HEAT repeat protein
MNHRKKILIRFAAIILIGSAIFIWLEQPSTFQDRTVEEWVRDLQWDATDEADSVARNAIAEAGTNAVPDLLRLLEKQDPWWVEKANHLLRQQNWTSYSFPTWSPYNVSLAFDVLGKRASVAVDRLIDIFTNNPSEEIRVEAASCLAAIGPSASNAVDALITSALKESPYVANACVVALTRIGAPPARVIPVYTNWLDDPWLRLSWNAASGLRSLGTNALDAVPSLLHVATNEVPDQKFGLHIAIHALETIQPETAERLNKELDALIEQEGSDDPDSESGFIE